MDHSAPTTATTTTPTAPAACRGWLLVVAAACLLLFAGLAAAVSASGGVDAFDTAVVGLTVASRSPALTAVATLVTQLGAFPVVVTVTAAAAVLLRRLTHRWSSSALLLTSVAVTAGVVYLVKIAVGRTRPAADLLLGTPSLDYAFPSGHTTDGGVAIVLTAVLVAAAVRRTAVRWALLIGGVGLAVAIGLTRVYLGYHWATDVIGGWLLAGAVICAALSVGLALRLPTAMATATATDLAPGLPARRPTAPTLTGSHPPIGR